MPLDRARDSTMIRITHTNISCGANAANDRSDAARINKGGLRKQRKRKLPPDAIRFNLNRGRHWQGIRSRCRPRMRRITFKTRERARAHRGLTHRRRLHLKNAGESALSQTVSTQQPPRHERSFIRVQAIPEGVRVSSSVERAGAARAAACRAERCTLCRRRPSTRAAGRLRSRHPPEA